MAPVNTVTGLTVERAWQASERDAEARSLVVGRGQKRTSAAFLTSRVDESHRHRQRMVSVLH